MLIEYLAIKCERQQARQLFQSRMQRFKRGQFGFDTDFFLPYYLFQVQILNGKTLKSLLLAIDAMSGELDLYGFAQAPDIFLEVETTRVGAIVLSEEKALALLTEKVRRMVYLQGFFKISTLRITGKLVRLLYIPYWVGFFARDSQITLEVIDAVRGCLEGGKVRNLVQASFTEEVKTCLPEG